MLIRNKMKKTLLFATLIIAFFSCNSLEKSIENKQKINETLDFWHEAAGNAKFEAYFNLMTETGVFIGTDATENWQNEAFKTFSKPYFEKGKAWNFKSLQRTIYLSKDQKTAWFDELLDTQMKICRGSGVLIKKSGQWKIAHYVLSMTIPNDKTSEVVKIKDQIETTEIQKLKSAK